MELSYLIPPKNISWGYFPYYLKTAKYYKLRRFPNGRKLLLIP